jgi:hypothetical protein
MNQEHDQGKKSQTTEIRRTEDQQDFYADTNGGSTLSGVSTWTGGERLGSDREIGKEGAGDFDPFGGVIDQLIEDAKKQLVKSQECITWYREEAKEYQQKLDNLLKLKELQQQQRKLMQEQQLMQQTSETSTNHNEGESLAG